MNKTELIEAVHFELVDEKAVPRDVVADVVESLLDVVIRSVADSEPVLITGFGRLEAVDRAAKTGRNPKTGEAVPIPARRVVRFVPAPAFNGYVQDPGSLPWDRSVARRKPAGR